MKQIFGIALRCMPLIFLAVNIALGWGSAAHKFINLKAVKHLPSSMSLLIADSTFYQLHASDADYRKNQSDTSFYAEGQRHFIDIDSYPNYDHLPYSLDSVISLYGRENVRTIGTLPWATQMVLDSLTSQLARGNLSKAESTMSDLGHYVADAHQPLHCTVNYDGWLTGNGGIHRRYETDMINAHQSSLTIHTDSISYVAFPLGFIFDYIDHSNSLVDSIMTADVLAKSISGWNGSGTPPPSYYDALWQKAETFTRLQIQQATVALASLWYTAWVDAQGITSIDAAYFTSPQTFILEQNYPNPFNPKTEIRFTVKDHQHITINIFDIEGRQIAHLIDEVKNPGTYKVEWNPQGIASGTYLYRIENGTYSQTRKMILVK